MKRLAKAGVVAVGAALVTQAAQAAFTANDLYLGFTQSSASGDYLIDLGQASSITGQSTVVDLSSYFNMSMFTSIFAGGAAGVDMGVVGGINQFPSSYDFYATAPLGADLSGNVYSSTSIGTAVGPIARLAAPAAGNGINDTTKSWAANIPVNSPNDFYGASGINPDLTIGGSGVLTEGLWQAVPGSTTYLGYFTLDTTGASPSLTFTSIQAVPEPGTASVLAGGALLLGILRWRTARKTA
ncbi:MAG TPA: hypothetical protein VFF11_14535 [Candidatus Binatia bacterium]|nr:hypothetical protein [Candidatus Binatia bacterium]